MRTGLISANIDMIPFEAETSLSFRPFVDHLLQLSRQDNIRKEFYHYVAEKFEEEHALDTGMDISMVPGHAELLNLIHMILTPMLYNEEEHFWALSTPNPGEIFFGTNPLYRYLSTEDANPAEVQKLYRQHQISASYKLLLDRFYNIPQKVENELVYQDDSLGITRYFKIHTDTSFIRISPKGPLPQISREQIEAYFLEAESEGLIEKLLPLTLFKFEGFSVITLTNITAQQAISNIEELLANHGHDVINYNQVFRSLITLAGTRTIEFGLLPLLTVNQKAVYLDEGCSQSIIMNSASKFGVPEETLVTLVTKFQAGSKPVVFNNLPGDDLTEHQFSEILKPAGIASYAVIPLFHRKQVTGILEIFSRSDCSIEQRIFSSIQPALAMLGQLMYYTIDEFNLRIESIIKEHFTLLKPAVQWKFNEVAWKYLGDAHKSKANMDDIIFNNVIPLYGAIDVRNSTIERNSAVHADIKNQLFLLISLLSSFKETIPASSRGLLRKEWKSWTTRINGFLKTKDEISVNRFLSVTVNPFLKAIQEAHPEAGEAIQRYFDAVSEIDGFAYKNRRDMELSLEMVNTTISSCLDSAQKTLQEIYPHYFEKFRTDGIEYDIYIGQSITPHIVFNDSHLESARVWQLRTMAEITRLTAALWPEMRRKLETTQLIFIHSNPIDIGFRIDEKRFDVEGAYSIRYEVIKKRIDKVLIRSTRERLTQPGKIAMVYFHKYEAEEYLTYIHQLQEENLLFDKIEFLDLERLQGVNGLKALRVGVKPAGSQLN